MVVPTFLLARGSAPGPSALWTRARRFARVALDLVLPPRCLDCGVVVAEPRGLCPSCWAELSVILPPHCRRCGRPMDLPVGLAPEDPDRGVLCGGCHAHERPYDRARAALVYDDASRPLVLGLKHGDRTDLARPLGAWMARAGASLLADADLIVPVPLHRWRLWRRRFNQSALLARSVARVSGRPLALGALRRRRATPSQGGLTGSGRKRNVAGAFHVPARWRAEIEGRRILLIDDVFTTGATVEECARTLLRAGATAVDVLACARVVKEERPDG